MLTAMPAPFNHGDERQQGSIVLETASGGDGPSDSVGMPLLGRTRARVIEAFVVRPVVFGSAMAFGFGAYVLSILGHGLTMPTLWTVGSGIFWVVIVPYFLLVWLTLRVSTLSQLCVRPGAWYFWGALVMGNGIAVFRESGNGPESAANTTLLSTAAVVLGSLLPMVDAMPRKFARVFGRFLCPAYALISLQLYTRAKLAEQPWTRQGSVWEWLVNDANGRTHEARLPRLRPLRSIMMPLLCRSTPHPHSS